jgi:intracellular multiplication protein IcmE
MSDNKDNIDNDLDLEDFGGGDGSGFDDFSSNKGTLGDLWRNNPMVKVGVILGAFAFIVAGVILFGGKDKAPLESSVTGNSDLSEAPGTEEVSESYRKAVEEENTRRIEEALRENESAVPMPVEPPKGTLGLQEEEEPQEDPLERWRKLQEERIQQQQILAQDIKPAEPEQPEVDTRTPAVNALSQAMSIQMEAVLQNQPIKPPRTMQVSTLAYLEGIQQREEAARQAEIQKQLQLQQLLAQQQQQQQQQKILIPAGQIEYAQLLLEANSDIPGPVMAELASGPLKGSRILGTFQVSDQDLLTLNFNTVVVDGVSTGTAAVAVDPTTTMTGMATDVDQRYFKRVVLPAAAEFIQGLTEAISESGRTTIEINSTTGSSQTATSGSSDGRQEVASGITEAGESLSDIMQEEADKTKPLVVIRAGTPIGILFTSPVIEGAQVTQPQQEQPVQNQQPIFLQPGFFPAGGYVTNPLAPATGSTTSTSPQTGVAR